MTIDHIRITVNSTAPDAAAGVVDLPINVHVDSAQFGTFNGPSQIRALDFAALDLLEESVTGDPISLSGLQGTTRAHAALTELGQQLFSSTLGRWTQWPNQLEASRRAGNRLRVEITSSSGMITAQPWELLNDPGAGAFLALDPIVSITRNPVRVGPTRDVPARAPLRVLLVAATPIDLGSINVAGELESLMSELSSLGGAVEVEMLTPDPRLCTFQSLRRALGGKGPWHVLHFAGHGGFDPGVAEGLLAFTDESGLADHVTASRLGATLASHPELRLVILNACRGAMGAGRRAVHSVAGSIVHQGVPAVVSMQFEVTDRGAIPFAQAFHRGIVAHGDVEQAVMEGRDAIASTPIEASRRLRSIEWASVVLHLDAPDSVKICELDDSEDGPANDDGPAPQRHASQLVEVSRHVWRLTYSTSLPTSEATRQAQAAIRTTCDTRKVIPRQGGFEALIGGLFPGSWAAVQRVSVTAVGNGSGSEVEIHVQPKDAAIFDHGMNEQAARRIAEYLNATV